MTMPAPAFWAGKRVLVTGHTGFKGAWLSLWLRELGAHVSGFALAPQSEPNLFEMAGVAEGIDSRIGDIRDARAVEDAVQSARPEVVLHLAAQALVRASYEDPITTYGTNVMGTVHVLDAIRRVPSVRAVVVVTSDKCYQNNEWHWGYRETEPMGGHDPYSASKGSAELVTASFRHSYFRETGPAVATARAGNVIGGGDWSRDRLVPDLVNAFTRGVPAEIRNPLAVRPWQHVLDPLFGYLLLAERLFVAPREHAEGWNFGPTDAGAESVAVVADTAASIWGAGASWLTPEGSHPYEARLLRLDSSKARSRLGWTPRLNLDEAIQMTFLWYRDLARGRNARAMTLAQIKQYTSQHR